MQSAAAVARASCVLLALAGACKKQDALPASGFGDFVEGDSYRFKVEGFETCGMGETARLGASVRIAAKVDDVAISAPDITLESAGVILRGQLPSATPIPGCPPLLAAGKLKRDQVAVGLVAFEIPAGYEAPPGSLTLNYRPARWGGGRRVQIPLPDDCLKRCRPPATPSKKSE